MTSKPRSKTTRVKRVLQEEYQASVLNVRAMQEVLGRAKRTIYNYLEGITELSGEQVLELTRRLQCPRLLTAWFEDNGDDLCVMPKISAQKLYDAAQRARAEVEGYEAVTDLVRTVEEALADGYIDNSERARIRRQRELAQAAVSAVALAAEGGSL